MCIRDRLHGDRLSSPRRRDCIRKSPVATACHLGRTHRESTALLRMNTLRRRTHPRLGALLSIYSFDPRHTVAIVEQFVRFGDEKYCEWGFGFKSQLLRPKVIVEFAPALAR